MDTQKYWNGKADEIAFCCALETLCVEHQKMNIRKQRLEFRFLFLGVYIHTVFSSDLKY